MLVTGDPYIRAFVDLIYLFGAAHLAILPVNS